MHIVTLKPQVVSVAGRSFSFAQGETIHTENSYKYPLPDFLSMLVDAGFGATQVWTDEQQWFAVIHAHA